MKITNIQPNDNTSTRKFLVFPDNSQSCDLIEKWFDDNKIYTLQFKCKAWNKLKRASNKLDTPKLIKFLESQYSEGIKLNFSDTAGCSCGCSPGYIGFTLDERLVGQCVWISDIEMTDDETNALKDKIAGANAELVLEIADNGKYVTS